MRTEQESLVWRYIGSVVLIAVTVGVAMLVSRWTGPLG